jgi:uncharacterized protein (TIGR03437 family)
MLRLVSATVGPVSVAAGTSPAAQTVEAYNAGSGSLSLSLSSSDSWVVPSVGTARQCTTTTAATSCLPLQFALNTSAVAAGSHTAIVTVSDPNAADAPQTITVTVQVGGSVPSSVDVYAAPGGSRDVSFSTNSQVSYHASTQDGSSWLSLVLDGTGSFRFSYPYRIHLAPQAGNVAGSTYTGTLAISGSSFAPDNRSVPVTMRVTSQPIADAGSSTVNVRLAQGAPAASAFIAVNNLGQGTLAIQSVSATGGSWLTATANAGGAVLTLDAGTLTPGTYTGSVTITTNAANTLAPFPVSFQVVAKGPPVINYQGVVDNATFAAGDTIAPGDIAVVLGEQFSFSPLAVGQAPPLAAQVGGATVLVNGQPAPLYYSSYGQLAFQMPVDAPAGLNLVQVQRDGLTSNAVSVNVASRAPRILPIGVGSYGAIVNPDYSIPMPVGSFPGVNTHPAHVGDTLTIYAIGLGPTSPSVATGQPAPAAEPFARVTTTPRVNFGGSFFGMDVDPLFAGLSPTYAGLYQVNVTIPAGVPAGTVNVKLVYSDLASNVVQIAVQ